MKMDRAGDSSFDRFESQALKETFDIPHDLQLVRHHHACMPCLHERWTQRAVECVNQLTDCAPRRPAGTIF